MIDMPKACDEFGSYLAKLRAERGMTGKQLGNAVGKSDDYIGGWERYPRPVNKQVLHKVCQALELSEAERHELFRLADLRIGVDARQEKHGWWGQMMLNVGQALAEVQHEIDPAVSSQDLIDLNEMASWALSCAAPDEYLFTRLAWPEWFAQQGIIADNLRDREDLEPIPEEVIAEELPDLDSVRVLNRENIRAVGMGMAAVYRRWLLADLHRCRAVVQRIRRWSIRPAKEADPVVALMFQDAQLAEFYDVPGVSVVVANSVRHRELAGFMWQWGNARDYRRDAVSEFPYPQKPVDSHAYMIFQLAQAFLTSKTYRDTESFCREAAVEAVQLRQHIQDALFTIRSQVWNSLSTVTMLLQLVGKDILPEKAAKALHEKPFEMEATLHPIIQDAKDLMTDTLEKAIKRLDREADRARVAELMPRTKKERKARAAKKKRAKAGKKTQRKRDRK